MLDDNTGAVTTQVCGPETVYIASTNVTVTKDSDDVAFTLNVTAISNEDLGIHSNQYIMLLMQTKLKHKMKFIQFFLLIAILCLFAK